VRSLKPKFSLFLALRYLKPKRTFVSIITLISVLGVTLGVAVLIVVISVMAGFEEKIKEVVLGFEPHITVETSGDIFVPYEDEPVVFQDLDDDGNPIPPEDGAIPELSEEQKAERDHWLALRERGRWKNVKQRLEAEELILEATPYVEGRILVKVEHRDGSVRQLAPIMRALLPDDSHQVRMVRELMKPHPDDPSKGGTGELNLKGPNIVMSRARARDLGVGIGSEVTIVSPKNIKTYLEKISPIMEDRTLTPEERSAQLDEISEGFIDPVMKITGLFDSLRYEDFVIIPMTEGQELYEFEDNDDIHGLAIHTADAYSAAKVDALINEGDLLTRNWKSQTWMDKHKLWFDQIRNERAMMYFVLFFIVIVAAFSIMNTMITVTVQKRKEIGVMKALGARETQIVWVFLAQGMVVGVVGMLLGAAAGNLVLEFREPLRLALGAMFGLEIFPEGLYGVPEIPAKRSLLDMSIICVGAFVLCTLAALLPAWFAARLDPAKALRE
jgi:lipoprotein-releasing system permease protein